MKLYLSSYDPNGISPELVQLVGANRRTAMIANANDDRDGADRAGFVEQELRDLRELGLDPFEIDLKDHLGDPAGLLDRLASCGLLWVRGGNSFVLRRAMRATGLDSFLPELVQAGLVYGGYSAGAVVAGSTMLGIDLVDDADEIVEPYPAEVVWEGLGLVPYSVAPHYLSDHPQTAQIDEAVVFWSLHGMPYRTLSDGESLLIDGDDERIVRT